MSTNDQSQADSILDQLNSEPAAESQPDELAFAASAESISAGETGQESTDDTAETPENQAKAAAPAGLSLRQKIDQRLAVIQSQLAEKEQLQLTYVYQKVPKPYYWRWKAEGNQVLSLVVGLKQRRRKMG